jgi:hypothetical protein
VLHFIHQDVGEGLTSPPEGGWASPAAGWQSPTAAFSPSTGRSSTPFTEAQLADEKQRFSNAVALVLSTFLEHDRWPAWEAVTPGSLWAIAYLVVFGSLIGFTAYTWLLANVSAAAVATYAYVNPMVALCLGALLAGESIPARTALAAPLILGSVALMQFVRPPSKDEMPIEEE